jgi:hypothetical protein
MSHDISLEALAFNLKLLGTTQKKILVSAGKQEDKVKMLPCLRRLADLSVHIFATPGTARVLTEHGIKNTLLHKISDGREPNITSFLETDRFDLVINVLTGNNDYDEASDSNLIRSLCVREGIPLYTDHGVAILAIEEMARKHETGFYRYKLSDPNEPWNLKKEFFQRVADKGGFACYHAHFDKAYLVSTNNLKLSQVDMRKKWDLYKYLKENYTEDDLLERISRGLEKMVSQGVTHCRSFIDADATVGLLPIQAALKARERFADRIQVEYAIQPLEGVLSSEARANFERACALADVVGGLPSRDRPLPEKHLDYVLSLAKELGKPVDIHVDQENNPDEDETELVALKTVEHGMEGRVRAVHAISLAAKPRSEQDRILKIAREAGLEFIVCPSAALSMKQLTDRVAPIHNSIAPLTALLEHQLPVYLGVDNIYDLFMPFVDGDMWVECRLLMEATRYYDIDVVSSIATDKSGFPARTSEIANASADRAVVLSGTDG